MPSKINLRFVALALPAGFCLMLLLGANCIPVTPPPPPPPPPGSTTLVSETSNVAPTRNFNPGAAGRTITVVVSGDVTGSRITVLVTDVVAGSTVAQDLSPTTNSTTVTFNSTNNGLHAVFATETAASSATYTILITEQ